MKAVLHKGGGGEGRRHNDNSEYGDTDGTTASYSSLEDEEADPADTQIALANDTEEDCNGNEVPATTAEAVEKLALNCDQLAMALCSDSESPTEPVSQRLVTELRARVVPGGGHGHGLGHVVKDGNGNGGR